MIRRGKNHKNLRVSRQEGHEGQFSNAPGRTAYSEEYHFENNNLRKIREGWGGEEKRRHAHSESFEMLKL